jgi:maleylacetate reductase
MHDFTVRRPARIVFRAGCVRTSGADEIKALGCTRVVLIGSARSLATPEALHLRSALGAVVVGTIDDPAEHVPEELVTRCAQRLQEWEADAVVAWGGGTPLGLAKALAPAVAPRLLKIVAIPTTYSGSEVNSVSRVVGH